MTAADTRLCRECGGKEPGAYDRSVKHPDRYAAGDHYDMCLKCARAFFGAQYADDHGVARGRAMNRPTAQEHMQHFVPGECVHAPAAPSMLGVVCTDCGAEVTDQQVASRRPKGGYDDAPHRPWTPRCFGGQGMPK